MKYYRKISRILFISFLLSLIVTLNSLAQTQPNELKLGLVLSGGGAKGFAHIGVLKVFEEEGIPISIITGTSIGTIVGALYSLGYSAQAIEDFAKTQDWEILLSDGVPRNLKSPFKQNYEQKYLLQLSLNKEDNKLSLPSGLVNGNNILNIFCGLMADVPETMNFADLPIPFACIAYDLTTTKEVVLTHGYLPKAMLASMAFPGVFSPVDYNGMKLIDGGIINNFPVGVAKDMGADILIGVDLQQPGEENIKFESITDVLAVIADKMGVEKHDRNVELADVVINPILNGISTFSFNTGAIDSIIKLGEIAAREKLPEIKRAIKDKNFKANTKQFDKPDKKEYLITDIILPEKYDTERKLITSRMKLAPGTKYTTDELAQTTTRIFAYGNFETVYYKLHPNPKGHSLELFINDKREAKSMLGAGINSTDVTALYYNYSQQNYSNILSLLTLDAKIAINPQAKLKFETHRALLSVVGFEMEGRFNKLEYFDKGDKLAKLDIGSASADIYSYWRIRNVLNLGSGLKHSYFNSSTYSNDSENPVDANAEEYYTSLYGFLTIDNRDNPYIPGRGIYLNSTISFLFDKVEFSDMTPVYSLIINTTTPVGKIFSVSANLYHRAIYNTDNFPLA